MRIRWNEYYDLLRYCTRYWKYNGGNPYRILKRSLGLYVKRGFKPKEIYSLGFMNPAMPQKKVDHFLSKKETMDKQARLNPSQWSLLTEDKGLFYRYCLEAGVKVPDLYALHFKKSPGWLPDGHLLKSRDNWISFLENDIPDEFVMKPARGTYAQEVHFFEKSESGFRDEKGNILSAEEVYSIMQNHPSFDRYVLQQRVKSHPEMQRLSNTKSIQSLRMVTLLDNNGDPKLFYTLVKIIASGNILDAFASGATGNFIANVEIDKGTLHPAVTVDPKGRGTFPVQKHPQTGVVFKGFQIPMWKESVETCLHAAAKLAPIRSIGWDVAVTPEGPVVLEANMWWDPAQRMFKVASLIKNLQP